MSLHQSLKTNSKEVGWNERSVVPAGYRWRFAGTALRSFQPTD
jgi:hypothetical protein